MERRGCGGLDFSLYLPRVRRRFVRRHSATKGTDCLRARQLFSILKLCNYQMDRASADVFGPMGDGFTVDGGACI